MFLSVPAREAVFNCGLKIDSLVSVNLRCNMLYFTSVSLISQSQDEKHGQYKTNKAVGQALKLNSAVIITWL